MCIRDSSETTVYHANCPIEIDKQLYVTVKGVKQPIPVCVVSGIKGNYQCKIEQDFFDVLKELGDGWNVYLHPVEGKIVKNTNITTTASFVSKKNIILNAQDINLQDLEMYSDYEVAMVKEGKTIFSNIYAKLIGQDHGNIILRFTHINDNYNMFVEEHIDTEEVMKHNNENFLFVSSGDCFLKNGGFYRYQKESFGIFEYEGMVKEEDTNAYMTFMKENTLEFLLLVGKERDEYRLFFYSMSKRIRAVEFLDFLASEYGLVNGTASAANGRVSATILQVNICLLYTSPSPRD